MFTLFDSESECSVNIGSSLPHWNQSGASYFVTFRMADSIPLEVSQRWQNDRTAWLTSHGIASQDPYWRIKLSHLPESIRKQFHNRFSRQYLEALDKGMGACALRLPAMQQIVANCLHHFDGERYRLGNFIIMPNHVHLIVCLHGELKIETQCTSWKRFSARLINQALGTKGGFWQE